LKAAEAQAVQEQKVTQWFPKKLEPQLTHFSHTVEMSSIRDLKHQFYHCFSPLRIHAPFSEEFGGLP
jgi:hypothetical protein